ASAGAEIVAGCSVDEVVPGFQVPEVKVPGFRVQTSLGVSAASSLIVATGGLSIPKLGATDLGYRIAREFGIAVVPPRPALVPLVFDNTDRARWADLTR